MTDFDDYKARIEWMHNAALSDRQHHADNITFNCRQLISSPFRLYRQEPYLTKMEASIERAIAATKFAQETLERELHEYRKLKIREEAA